MNYFITGGAGFIGSHMVDILIKNGQVTVYDNLSSGKMSYIKHYLNNPDFKFIKGDVSNLDNLTKNMKKYDIVFHFASNPDIARGMIKTDLDLREGTILTYNILESMRKNGIRKILFVSGSGVYGDSRANLTPENFGPLLPISLYGASKLACEGLISSFCHLFDMQAWIFRFANVVGKRQTHGVGYDFIKKLQKNPNKLIILGDGTQSKSYIHISDAISAMLFCLENADEKINLFNIASDDYIDVKRVAEIVVEEMGLKNVKFIYTGGNRGWKGDVPKIRFDLAKIHNLGWKAKLNSEEAIRLSIREILGRE